jgi:hypothetical protein
MVSVSMAPCRYISPLGHEKLHYLEITMSDGFLDGMINLGRGSIY